MNYQSNYLALSWSTSKGRDTYGYNICRLDNCNTDKRHKCIGGGYDMVGTVVGEYLEEAFQDRLVAAGSVVTGLYGTRRTAEGKVSINGACGLECVIKIAEVIGVNITSNYNSRKKSTEGFFVAYDV